MDKMKNIPLSNGKTRKVPKHLTINYPPKWKVKTKPKP